MALSQRTLDSINRLLQKHLKVLITGGHGFIGSHVAAELHRLGYYVRVADKAPKAWLSSDLSSEFVQGNLCDSDFCFRIVRGADVVLHFAATMGGMGTIHSQNDHRIYLENHAMTRNLLEAALGAGVKYFFFASSACVYPTSRQTLVESDFRLAEPDVWANPPPAPQGLYGLEKLASEMLLNQYKSRLQIRIARFHNIYGPGGAWRNGHEKAPAALTRKAIAAKIAASVNPDSLEPLFIELWGDGKQRRSFLFVDDAVDAILRLLASDCSEPVNIGSEDAVSIRELAEIALDCMDLGPSRSRIRFVVDTSKPVGVAARNSDNTFIRKTLQWTPTTSLREGIKKTASWMTTEVNALLCDVSPVEHSRILGTLRKSVVVDLRAELITFAILLPITSRGSNLPETCLINLSRFARSLVDSTWRDTHTAGGAVYNYKIYLGIDSDDEFLLTRKPEIILQEAGVTDVSTLICGCPKGHVCALWRDLARQAWTDPTLRCDYFVLMGDDVILEDEGWVRKIHSEFTRLTEDEKVPLGFGCVAFTDISFPGMPTFPVIGRFHMEVFGGEVVPETFINQDGDPYLFQLYRRFGCSSMVSSRISNTIGGRDEARYEKSHAVDWTFATLDNGTRAVEHWLEDNGHEIPRKLTLDVIVPSYRVQLLYLRRILELRPSPSCTVMFIIIVDNSNSPQLPQLLLEFGSRPDIRIRINKQNLGASAARNRGMSESSAEWIHFLDDDVVPQTDLLVEAEKVIRAHPDAAGFVCNTQFPVAENIFTTAVHLAGVTYFWDIATKWAGSGVPWGVTANLITRRNIKDNITYDLIFPKTGGGEDIDYCLKKHKFFMEIGGEGFWPAPEVVATHPWWNNGKRSYWRFFGWSKGDGALTKLYPEHCYQDFAPSSAELVLLGVLFHAVGLMLKLSNHTTILSLVAPAFIGSAVLANVVHDMYRHLYRDKERTKTIKSNIVGLRWLAAVPESSAVRMFSEAGRLIGLLERGEFSHIGRRFDWFVGRAGHGPRDEERKNSRERLTLAVVIFAIFVVVIL